MSELQIVRDLRGKNYDTNTIIFDFDGTISTLRQGWEGIMEPLMIEMICGNERPSKELAREIKDYIDESTGIQTIFQMEWLAEKVKENDINKDTKDCWEYKAIYNERLLAMVKKRIKLLESGDKKPDNFLIKGSIDFLQGLYDRGYKLYLASGTDLPDLVHEAEILGVKDYFIGIVGAPLGRKEDSKAKIICQLLQEREGNQLMVIGDGKVEISLGVEKGAVTLGMATDEIRREGINEWKSKRLIKAGAHAIAGDFLHKDLIYDWLVPL